MDENQVGKKRRARRTGKEVQRLVEEFISGGMKRSDFCRSKGLSLGTLRQHLEGGKQGARQTPRWLRLSSRRISSEGIFSWKKDLKAISLNVYQPGARHSETAFP